MEYLMSIFLQILGGEMSLVSLERSDPNGDLFCLLNTNGYFVYFIPLHFAKFLSIFDLRI